MTTTKEKSVKPCRYCGALSHEAFEPSVTCIAYLRAHNAALLAVAEAVKSMKHDIDIFYAKYRDNDNKYIANLNQALSNLNSIKG